MNPDGINPAVVFDRHELIARCLGNLEFAERILSKFQTRFEEDLSELEQAASASNAERIASVAHRLKGASANAAAHALRDRTAEIEELARRQTLREIPSRLQGLRCEWSRFTQSVTLPGAVPDRSFPGGQQRGTDGQAVVRR